MKKKEKTSLQMLKDTELVKLISETKAKLAEYRVNRYSKQSKNVRELTAMKRKLAVASTILRAKEIAHE